MIQVADVKVTFAKRLKKLMDELGWANAHLMAALSDRGYEIQAVSTVDRWLRGDTAPNVYAASAIADALNVSLDWLTGHSAKKGAA